MVLSLKRSRDRTLKITLLVGNLVKTVLKNLIEMKWFIITVGRHLGAFPYVCMCVYLYTHTHARGGSRFNHGTELHSLVPPPHVSHTPIEGARIRIKSSAALV